MIVNDFFDLRVLPLLNSVFLKKANFYLNLWMYFLNDYDIMSKIEIEITYFDEKSPFLSIPNGASKSDLQYSKASGYTGYSHVYAQKKKDLKSPKVYIFAVFIQSYSLQYGSYILMSKSRAYLR